jgi:hypothetical protein
VSHAEQPLPVDLAELCIALAAEGETSELTWFLDRDSGRVILVSREYDPNEWGGLTVQDIEGNPTRFTPVPAADPALQLDDMKTFVAALSDVRLKESLEIALSAPRPERRFRAVLGWLPSELERWHAFRQQRSEARATAWLASVGVTPSTP